MRKNKVNYRIGLIHSLVFGIITMLSLGCDNKDLDDPQTEEIISAVDFSSYPEIQDFNLTFYNHIGEEEELLTMLNSHGVNTIRLRLWVNPSTEHSGFSEVSSFCEQLKSLGFHIWITLHYSDSWADPSQQETPGQWQDLSFTELNDSVYTYTTHIMETISPEYIQIGNEINSGFLHPLGHITANEDRFIELLNTGISAVRHSSETSKIIMHYAGILGANSFFDQISELDFDMIGLSYYPIWHGKSLSDLSNTLDHLGQSYDKDVIIAETAYPFTLEWNDWTNNIVGLESQLILPDYPSSPFGQQQFIAEIAKLSTESKRGVGFCYWGGELVSWKGSEANDASPWENQALFDFNNKALPVLDKFDLN